MWGEAGSGAGLDRRRPRARERLMGINDGCHLQSDALYCCWFYDNVQHRSHTFIQKEGWERWETASALRADAEDQRSVLGTPRIQSSDSSISYISSRECDSRVGRALTMWRPRTSTMLSTPRPFLVHYLTLDAKMTQSMGVIAFVLYEQGNQVWRGLSFSGTYMHSTTERDPNKRPCHWARVLSPWLPGEISRSSPSLRNGLQPTGRQCFTWKEIWKVHQRQGCQRPGESLTVSRAPTTVCP